MTKNSKISTDTHIIYFGTSEFSIYALEQLIKRGVVPCAIVTVPDRPAGRKMEMASPPLKIWALSHGVNFFQFEKLKEENTIETLKMLSPDLFIVASYGKIIPEALLQIPKHGALNVHPSLLPKLRGATPLQTSIIQDMEYTGVSIIQMDKEMDHGPIVAMHEEKIPGWPLPYPELEKYLALKGANILTDSLEGYISGKLKLTEQIHENATFTKKIEKQDGFITLDELTGEAGWNTFLKYNALIEWPGLFFFAHKGGASKGVDGTVDGGVNIRVKVKEASWNTALETMEILRVVPEGKKEMTWKDFENYIA
ncbi:MAG: methionyl-tRNA formyltransferase [Candidatus Pacebacteria bacterium]|nr:methionyl-tRNA formyltransferase [Candidatus Paceibacterota bacterium]